MTFSGEFIRKTSAFIGRIGLSILALLGAPTVLSVSHKIFNSFSSLFILSGTNVYFPEPAGVWAKH